MVWVYIALALILAFLMACHFLRVKFSLSWQSFNNLQGTLGLSFLSMGREFTFYGGQGHGPLDQEFHEIHENKEKPDSNSPKPSSQAFAKPDLGQAGFIRIPRSLIRYSIGLRRRLRKTFIKLALDPRVWRFLLAYLARFAQRGLRLLHFRLEYLHVGFDDVLLLGRFAAVWSTLSGIFPFLACPVQYGFNEKPASIKVGLTGGFTALNLIGLSMVALFSFPWLTLAGRFRVSWRNPELNRWQRRLLLF
jgi:hypothetical protein